jgi:K+/H+ antiporter YhaU regulatory subunit KhtT
MHSATEDGSINTGQERQRSRELIMNPEPQAMLQANDLVGLVGDGNQLPRAQEVLTASGGGSR